MRTKAGKFWSRAAESCRGLETEAQALAQPPGITTNRIRRRRAEITDSATGHPRLPKKARLLPTALRRAGAEGADRKKLAEKGF